MAQLDRFIHAMLQRPGAELFMEADAKPVLRANGKQAPIMDKKPSAQQLRQLIGEIVPGDVHDALKAQGAGIFRYQLSGSDPVELEVSKWAAEICIVVRAHAEVPGGSAEEAPPAMAPLPERASTFARAGGKKSKRPSRAPKGAAAELEVKVPKTLSFDLEPSALEAPPISAASPVAVKEAPAGSPPAGSPEPASGAERRAAAAAMAAAADTSGMDRLFHVLVKEKASDLHLSSDEVPMLRKDGDMVRLQNLNVVPADEMMKLLLPIMPEHNRAQFDEVNDTDFAYEIKGLARFRCNVFRDRKGPGGVFRIIPAEILSAEKLGLPQAIMDLGKLHKGLVVVTGPTGSGKSTTLCALIDLVNRTRSGHIITIEDPIEFVHQNKKCLVNQREVGVHTGSFKGALRAALREDPDIILVGEMRDLETIAIAIETAETGHLVFGTLHTTTAYSTIDRIIDQFPPDRQEQIRVMLSESLKGVVAQTLCKKIGGGRVAALEVLISNSAVANLIREGKTFQIPSIMQTGRNSGMQMLNESLLDLVKKRLVEPAEALSKCVDKAGMKLMFQNNGITL